MAIPNIDFREKLKVECPNVLKQAGLVQVDFGSAFLSSKAEGMIGQGQAIANDVIDTLNAAKSNITPEALAIIPEAIQFIIKDLIGQVTAYATGLFERYISPEFPLGLLSDIQEGLKYYTKMKLKTPDQILKELQQDMTKQTEDAQKEADKKQTEEKLKLVKEKIDGVLTKIEEVMDQIQPYTDMIAEYMVLGPDYIASSLESLYKDYLAKGISIVDTEVGKVQQIIDDYVDYAAMQLGFFAAEKANEIQKALIKKGLELAQTLIVKLQNIAMALINKAVMLLLGLLGG